MEARVIKLGGGKVLVGVGSHEGVPSLVFVPASHRGLKGGKRSIGKGTGLLFAPEDLAHPETVVIQLGCEKSREV